MKKLAPWLIGFVLIGWAAVKMLPFPVWHFRKNRAAKLLWTKIPAIETNKAGLYRINVS
jgi:hypothetical protein